MSLPQGKAAAAEDDQHRRPIFHDFLGNCPSDSSSAPGPISSSSDLASERLVSNHYEEVPQFVSRSDIEINQRLVRRKRRSSDSAFPSLAREAMARIVTDSNENSHLMKVLPNVEGDRSRRSNDEYAFVGMQRLQQGSGSLVLHSGNSSRNDATVSKWDQPISMNMGPAVQFPPRIRNSSMVPIPNTLPNRFREVQAGGSSTMSQTAADEWSRTGMKGPSILNSIKAGVGTAKNSQGLVYPANRAMTRSLVAEPESSNTPRQNGMRPEGQQMTIFYGGQAHVFDDVDPNKADVIMALAGSNGGSWSTIYSPKPKSNLPNEGDIIIRENSSGGPNDLAFVQHSYGNPRATRDPDPVVGSRDRISNTAGGPVGGIVARETRNLVEVTELVAK